MLVQELLLDAVEVRVFAIFNILLKQTQFNRRLLRYELQLSVDLVNGFLLCVHITSVRLNLCGEINRSLVDRFLDVVNQLDRRFDLCFRLLDRRQHRCEFDVNLIDLLVCFSRGRQGTCHLARKFIHPFFGLGRLQTRLVLCVEVLLPQLVEFQSR